MNDNTTILEVRDLHKYYEKQEVLKGISTTVKKGMSLRSSDHLDVENQRFSVL